MKEVWEKIERFNSHLITPAIVVLLAIIVIELFVHPQNETIKIIIRVLDYAVIAVFVIDLTFLALKARSTSFFFKHYWLDVLAVFPFSVLFSVVTRAYEVTLAAERLALGQSIIHEGLEANKEIEALGKGNRAARIVRIASRSLKVIAKSRLFNVFSSKHQLARKKVFGKKETKKERVRREKINSK